MLRNMSTVMICFSLCFLAHGLATVLAHLLPSQAFISLPGNAPHPPRPILSPAIH
ncbi:hypothetical protein BDY21DRAFT_351903 [Lineolata rhizophorae]|uniref:Uncharacterized protein n=1 Tax=Lineolata rhizophorae TaxID=578093 RepID=A0A6A6NT30_9PEZI|nr:hypothetical protein BDY21DRAFT_351903 [Lineolata rhizophorae]